MSNLEHTRAMLRLVLTLEKVVQQCPEITTVQLLACARALPSVIMDGPRAILTNDRAASLYVDDLVDQRLLPPWCGGDVKPL